MGGADGSISISGGSVEITNNIGAYYGSLYTGAGPNPFTTSPYKDTYVLGSGVAAVFSLGNGPSTINRIYLADADYAAGARRYNANIGPGDCVEVNGVAGSLQSIQSTDGITIDTAFMGTTLSGGTYFRPGNGQLTVTENGIPVTIPTGQPVSPAEWIALTQVSYRGSQSLVLDENGEAAGGSFAVTSQNIPTGGFNAFVLPAGVTLNSQAGNLTFSGTATIGGNLNFVSGGSAPNCLILNAPQPGHPSLLVASGGSLTSDRGLAIVGHGNGVTFMFSGSVSVQSGTLQILAPEGDLDLSGLFGSGNFSTGGAGFAAAAGGVITATDLSTAMTLDAINVAGPGGNITLAAGADFTVANGVFTLNGASGTGGSIVLPSINFKSNSGTIAIQANAGSGSAGSIMTGNVDVSGSGGAAGWLTNSGGAGGAGGDDKSARR